MAEFKERLGQVIDHSNAAQESLRVRLEDSVDMVKFLLVQNQFIQKELANAVRVNDEDNS